MPKELLVSEIFYSLQGEGISVGTPSAFLRLALCNLRCRWCDTRYTWDWQSYDFDEEVKVLSVEEVAKRIRGLANGHLVITGGEPLLQQAALVELLGMLKPDYYVEVETNGTLLPREALARLVDQWNVSPKLGNSGNPLEDREREECYHWFAKHPRAYFKYVVQEPQDLVEVEALVSKYSLPKERVLVMPEGTSREVLQARMLWLAEECLKRGYRLSPRLHIELWGNRRER